MNETPKNNQPINRRLEDRLANVKAGKSLQIVVQGNCRVCKRRSATIPATKTQVMRWFSIGDTKGFLKYQIVMLTEGTHRECQKVKAERAKGKKVATPARRVMADIAPADIEKMERVMARRKKAVKV